jgi:anti-sigma factor ChrR (cupin superfamily)
MIQDWNLDGRNVVNWTSCDWQPHPGREDLAWHPVRETSRPNDGYYLLHIPPGGSAPVYDAGIREEFIVLDGSLIDGDGLELAEGDFVSYQSGTSHDAGSPNGCTLLAYIARVSDERRDIPALVDSRKVANWKTVPFEPYPGLPDTGNPLVWYSIRGNSSTAAGFYIVRFPPGATSAAHEHIGYEEFIVLDGSLTDCDGTTYFTNDCVSLPPGSTHASHSESGCVTAAMNNGPFRVLVDEM